MKLRVSEPQLKLIEQQQLNELKWLANVRSHIGKMDVPLTSSLVNYIWGKQRVTTFHVGDVHGIDDMGSIVGSRKSLSTFRYMDKVMVKSMRGIQTEGGIIYQIEGNLQFDAPRDIMSAPDETGRRWVNIYSFPENFRKRLEDEYYVRERKLRWDSQEEYGFDWNDAKFDLKDLMEYYRLMESLIKEYAKEIREYFADIKGRQTTWNETVVNNIQIKDILWKEDIVDFLETWETKEQKINVIKEIGIKLNSIATGNVYLSDNGRTFGFRRIDPVKWVEERGGITNFDKYAKKFHKDKEPTTIQIGENNTNTN